MTASALMDADEGYDVMWILPISALFKDIMWVKVGRTQWVLIEEMPGEIVHYAVFAGNYCLRNRILP